MTDSAARPDGRASDTGIISLLANHPVAANLLMVMMLLAGVWGIRELNTQFFPTFNIDYVSVRVNWSGASAEDVEELITTPLERVLRDVDFVRQMTSTSTEGQSVISLEFEEGTDMGLSVDRVKHQAAQVRNLPQGAEDPVIRKTVRYENVGKVLVTGDLDLEQLRPLVNRMEQELLERGIAKIFVRGLPKEQIAIEIPSRRLRELGLSLDDVARRISAWSRNVPVGVIGQAETSHQLRFRERRQSGIEFEAIPVVASDEGRLILLGDIAEIRRKTLHGQETIHYRDRPAVELSLNRNESSDSLEAARILKKWVEDTQPLLPPGVELVPFSQQWELLQQRINLLLKNGLGGLAMVLLILFLFLHAKVAFWVAVGIPVSFMAALGILYTIGGSINMVSLFGMIMALGIIVDDAIVVGEEAMSEYQSEGDHRTAPERATRRMLAPVLASSLTTIASFLPLVMIGGIMGAILGAIPVVVICIIIASLVECFLIMPGHLTHAMRRMDPTRTVRGRKWLDHGFLAFRERLFRPVVKAAVNFPWTVVAMALAMMIATLGWLGSGRMAFQFFPTPDADRIYANVSFVSGTPAHVLEDYLLDVERALYAVEEDLGQPFIHLTLLRYGSHEVQSQTQNQLRPQSQGSHLGSLLVELTDPDRRNIRNRDIVSAWRERLPPVPGRESLSIVEPRAGPPGSDLDIRILGDDIDHTKEVAAQLSGILRQVPGVYGISDDAPYGRTQMVLELTPTAQALGLSVESISAQLRTAYDGITVQELSDGFDELDVRVSLPEAERHTLASLEELDIVLPGGGTEPIGTLVVIRQERGFETIRHSGGHLAVTVKASVDPAVANTNEIRAELEQSVLPGLSRASGVRFTFEGRQADQGETLQDMRFALIPALGLIYLVLAWVFGSYGWPLIVMAVIPFGLIGVIWGHVVMGIDLTILSLFGLFGLAGIVVNDAIILVVRYRRLKDKGIGPQEGVVEATCQRLRAVILTSLTTIGGLTPLLFESSLQARFLIPMATSIAFGLGFATFLVLFLVPALLSIYENAAGRLAGRALPQT